MFGYEFANPKYFLILVLLVPMILWYVFREKRSHADLQFSSLKAFKGMKHAGRVWLRHVLFALKVLAIVFLVTALARPQSSNSWQTYTSEGIDIMLALDISGSMLARDFSPDRLEAAKDVDEVYPGKAPGQNRSGGVCRGEFYAVSPDDRPGGAGESDAGCSQRYD